VVCCCILLPKKPPEERRVKKDAPRVLANDIFDFFPSYDRCRDDRLAIL
jgi:hypothetical protein